VLLSGVANRTSESGGFTYCNCASGLLRRCGYPCCPGILAVGSVPLSSLVGAACFFFSGRARSCSRDLVGCGP